MQNKNYIVVGASKGIGLGITKHLLENNANVFTTSRGELPNDISNNVKRHFQINVTSEFKLDNLPEIIDGIVYCPGNINLKPFNRFKDVDFVNDFNLNLVGMVRILNQTINQLKNSDNGSVLMFSSVASKLGMSFHSSTASSKSAIEGFVKSMAAEYAPKIRFNAIAPTLTDTPLAQNLLSTDEKRQALAEKNPLKRIGTIDDIVQMSMFLLSENSTYITGQIISVDGGMGSIK